MSQPQQAQQTAAKKSGRAIAIPQKGAKRKIMISKIKVIPALALGTVVETQY